MARIGVDLDGVFYDFAGALRAYLTAEMKWPEKLFSEQKAWEFYRPWGMTTASFVAICDQAADAGLLWNHHPANAEEVQALRDLEAAGHTLHIITDRTFGTHPGVSQYATAQWLVANEIPYHSLTFSPDKTIVQTDYMFDDKVQNYLALEAAGTKAYLITKPWNAHLELARRVMNVQSFARDILDPLPF